jgi:hypothetical protein
LRQSNHLRLSHPLPFIELLDSRRLLSGDPPERLVINGTEADDEMRVIIDAVRKVVVLFGIDGVEDGTERAFPPINESAMARPDIHVRGHSGNDEIRVEVIWFRGGFDGWLTVDGGSGDDRLLSAVGSINGGAGDDHLEGIGRARALSGGTGDDTLVGGDDGQRLSPGPGNDSIDGGGGTDMLDTEGSSAIEPIVIRLDRGAIPSDGFGGSDTIIAVENVSELGRFDDVLYGDEADNHFVAWSGSDLIVGNGGNDFLQGGEGTHTLLGGDGDDTIASGSDDESVIDGGNGADHIRLFPWHGEPDHNDTIVGDAADTWTRQYLFDQMVTIIKAPGVQAPNGATETVVRKLKQRVTVHRRIFVGVRLSRSVLPRPAPVTGRIGALQ